MLLPQKEIMDQLQSLLMPPPQADEANVHLEGTKGGTSEGSRGFAACIYALPV